MAKEIKSKMAHGMNYKMNCHLGLKRFLMHPNFP